jgi:hypothetical protein
MITTIQTKTAPLSDNARGFAPACFAGVDAVSIA